MEHKFKNELTLYKSEKEDADKTHTHTYILRIIFKILQPLLTYYLLMMFTYIMKIPYLRIATLWNYKEFRIQHNSYIFFIVNFIHYITFFT